jgi:hypothetical protein
VPTRGLLHSSHKSPLFEAEHASFEGEHVSFASGCVELLPLLEEPVLCASGAEPLCLFLKTSTFVSSRLRQVVAHVFRDRDLSNIGFSLNWF